MLGKIKGRRRRGKQRIRWLNRITDSMDINLSKIQEIVKGQGSLVCCSPWGHKESDRAEQQPGLQCDKDHGDTYWALT